MLLKTEPLLHNDSKGQGIHHITLTKERGRWTNKQKKMKNTILAKTNKNTPKTTT